MYIRNKSGLIQECHNEDVIKTCRKDTGHFMVAEDLESLIVDEEVNPPKAKTELKELKADELKALAKEKGIKGAASLTKDELLAVLKDVI